ncbi:MAG: tRNA (adenine(22)-N(1))-methyltransferase [Syntrophomonadaceae bacterium]|nr:tRNA (adenine(22)-N(1))-methyltransferase [Bacillota bacterium]
MKLTPRLAALAELVPAGSVVADIGTDHAYLPVYLVQERSCRRVVASDISPGPLAQARETVTAFNCLHKIDLRLGEGLQVLHADDGIDTVVIAGLGGRKIAALLDEGRDKLQWVSRLLLQPAQDAAALRLYLAGHGFALLQEALVLEGRRLYEIILAGPGREEETDPFRLAVGPRLLEGRPPLLPRLLREKMRRLKSVRNSLQKARYDSGREKIREVEQELSRLEEVLHSAALCPDAD